MARALKMYHIKNLETQEDEEKIKAVLKGVSGIIRVNPESRFAIIEIEFEDALIDAATIRDLLAKEGYQMII
ncbi:MULTISPECIES: hypothetical protein [Kosmotoga]|jgi:copper chaperone CopZ|uniref:HMA domain-containing protein n=1 Tax=Kosmotoga olearia (strain ATCC BAA-1733 / DSM 21960 / TBF 19.5.1) TaxID=521045 RepID=C5CG20_KOSOT|nr:MULTISPECIES: hypothetical protein [Kosmotoga]ACR79461.1 hypothetical protein Kole_0747 [Kosmotoga olearia TBF 19.5.1]MDI3524307.1 hypothetical protein [Kosmotoga sp.]MDK2954083.1 hypothetical protein [Kosmotoga sp.]OAA22480.1 hypothetical protein DU53_04065 [Kosmotoga sp. DU53]